MIDIKWIRKNPTELDNSLINRNIKPQSHKILKIDKKYCKILKKNEILKEKKNKLSNNIKEILMKNDFDRIYKLKKKVLNIKKEINFNQQNIDNLKNYLNKIILNLPNIPLKDTPIGIEEKNNIEIRKFTNNKKFNFVLKKHYEIKSAKKYINYDIAAKISGSRFSVLLDKIAKLERAIGQFMLDIHTKENNYIEVSVPILVRENAVYSTAQLPKFSLDLFQTTDGRWLIPTGEVPLTNLVNNQIFNLNDLPLRFVCLSPCFRSEAGSSGKDTSGILRQHQFWKVEIVSITDKESSLIELERMTKCAEKIMQKLEIPFRTVLLCTGEISFSSCKTYDIEVWLAGQKQYKEISSCSICGDFQSRRMNARYRDKKGKLHFLHTLNGSGVAVGRCLAAIIEYYQQEDESIVVPKVLRSYMDGCEVIK